MGWGQVLQLGEELGEEVQGGRGGELPPQFLENQHLHILKLGEGDAAVSEDDQLVQGERSRVGELRGDAETGGRQELELWGGDGDLGEDGVQVDDGTEEHLAGAVVLAELQHPVSHDLPVLDQDLGLDPGDVVPALALVLPLRGQEVLQDSLAEKDPVRRGSDEGWSGWRAATVRVNLHHVFAGEAPVTYWLLSGSI